MKRIEYLAIIGHDIGLVFRYLGIVTVLPLAVALLYGEWGMILPMGVVPAIFFLAGTFFGRIPTSAQIMSLSVALASVALTWWVVAAISALPFMLALHMSLTDSFFEAMSGWSCTGLTMLTSLDTAPRTIIFWRSFMQWLGGIGVIAFGITMLNRSGLMQFRLYRSEGRPEAFMPSIISTARMTWGIYVFLTVFFIALVWWVSRIPIFDAINVTMTAIATGGFTPHDRGIPYYASPMLEFVLIPVMIAGAMPFRIYFQIYRRNYRQILSESVGRSLLILIAIGSTVVIYDLLHYGMMPFDESFRSGLFMSVSAITSTGFQTAAIAPWPRIPVIMLIMMMLIGGAAGSTAGGVKVDRLVLAYEGLLWWFRRFFVKRNAIIPFKHEGRSIPERISEVELSKNVLTIALFILVVFISTLVCLHLFIPHGMRVEEVVFDIVSAIGGNGLTAGYISPWSPAAVKWVFIFVMWMGRLEIIPVIVLFLGLLRGFESRIPR